MRNVKYLLILSLAFSAFGLFAEEGAPPSGAPAQEQVASGDAAKKDKAPAAPETPKKNDKKKKPAVPAGGTN